MTLPLSLFACISFVQPQELPEAPTVLDRVDAALGAPVRNVRFRGSVSWQGDPARAEAEEVYGGLGRARNRYEYSSFGVFELCADGGRVWEHSPTGLELREGWEACAAIRRHAREQHVPWRELYADAHTKGEESLEGRPCIVLDLAPRWLLDGDAPEGATPPPDTFYVDLETHLPRRVISRAPGASGNRVEVIVDYADWRESDMSRWAHRREVTISDWTQVLTIASVEVDVELPERFFTARDDVIEAAASRSEGASDVVAEPISVEVLEERHFASIRVQCRYAEIQATLAAILPESMEAVTSRGATIAGVPSVRYYNYDLEALDIEGGIPVAAPIESKGRVRTTTLPGGRAVVAWHVGPYTTLGEMHTRIDAYMKEHGLVRGSAPWEEYWTDPGMEPDPGKWRTKVVYPVAE